MTYSQIRRLNKIRNGAYRRAQAQAHKTELSGTNNITVSVPLARLASMVIDHAPVLNGRGDRPALTIIW